MPIKNNDATRGSNNNRRDRSGSADRRNSGRRSNQAPSSNNGNNGNGDSSYYKGEMIPISGILEIMPDFGVIRQDEKVSDELPKDVYTSPSQIRRCNLRMGDFVTGFARAPNEGERYLSLLNFLISSRRT